MKPTQAHSTVSSPYVCDLVGLSRYTFIGKSKPDVADASDDEDLFEAFSSANDAPKTTTPATNNSANEPSFDDALWGDPVTASTTEPVHVEPVSTPAPAPAPGPDQFGIFDSPSPAPNFDPFASPVRVEMFICVCVCASMLLTLSQPSSIV